MEKPQEEFELFLQDHGKSKKLGVIENTVDSGQRLVYAGDTTQEGCKPTIIMGGGSAFKPTGDNNEC